MKKALILVVVLLSVFIGVTITSKEQQKTQDQAPYITVTSFALYDIAMRLTGEEIEVKKLIPFGVEMHTFMPSVKTMSALSEAELFIFTGLGMEPWIKKAYPNQVDMSRFVKLKEACEEESEDEETHSGHHHEEEADPHYWLDIDNMKKMTEALLAELNKHFPEHKGLFEKNANTYIEELTLLDDDYKKALAMCRHREIVVNHNAFGYLGQQYGFGSHSVTGLSPDEQVSAKKMKEITDLVRQEQIKVVFFESFVSPKVAETISKETGAQAQSLQPLANVREDEAAKGYALLMRENLQKLVYAMECE